jgi:predicted FMN-binding regulatory protein PaiB
VRVLKILAFIESQDFATVVSSGEGGSPIASHLPVDVLRDSSAEIGVKLITHIANGNPHLPELSEEQEVLIIFLSNSNYISPS